MGIFKKVNSEFHNESNHLIVHFSLLIHVDGKIWLVGRKIHSFSLFEMAFMIERRTLVPMVSEYEIETFKDKNA